MSNTERKMPNDLELLQKQHSQGLISDDEYRKAVSEKMQTKLNALIVDHATQSGD